MRCQAEVDEVARAPDGAAGFEVPAAQELGDAYALFIKDRDGIRIEVVHEGGEE